MDKLQFLVLILLMTTVGFDGFERSATNAPTAPTVKNSDLENVSGRRTADVLELPVASLG